MASIRCSTATTCTRSTLNGAPSSTPTIHRGRGRGGVGRPGSGSALRERGGSRSGRQLRPAGGGLRRRTVSRHRHREPQTRRPLGLVEHLGAVEPRRDEARDPLRPAHPDRGGDGLPAAKHGVDWVRSGAPSPRATARRGNAAHGPRPSSFSRCLARATSIRGRSSACTRLQNSVQPIARIPRFSAALAPTTEGTAAACRYPGIRMHPCSALAQAEPICRSKGGSPGTACRPRRSIPGRRCSSTGVPFACVVSSSRGSRWPGRDRS